MVMDDINAGGSIAQAALGKMDPIPRLIINNNL